MRRTLVVLIAVAVALGAAAGPALADDGQSAVSSVGVVQVGTAEVSPQTSADAPSTATAPVAVASTQETDGAISTGGASTEQVSSTGGETGPGQQADSSIAVVQIGGIEASPQTSADAPITATTPVAVASTQETGGGESTEGAPTVQESSTGGETGPGQQVDSSIAVVQVGGVAAGSQTEAGVPVTTTAPIAVASAQAETSQAAPGAPGEGDGQEAEAAQRGQAPSATAEPGAEAGPCPQTLRSSARAGIPLAGLPPLLAVLVGALLVSAGLRFSRGWSKA